MIKEFKYCDNPDAEVPRMFIDKEIGGKDSDGLPNIDGNIFLKELMYLSDVLGKSRIEVWINSPGGIVTDGQSIYAAILESKCNVDTICYGIAASIAGVIFQAGKKRIMLDYAKLMYHPAYSEDGRKDKGLEALNHSICVMISKRTGKTEDEVWSIMNRGRIDDKGTWIGSDEAKADGFCDEVRNSDAKNLQYDGMIGMWKTSNKIHNRLQDAPIKTKKMKNVLNKLGLVEDANETSAIAAIDAMNKSMDDLKKQYDKAKEECAKLKEEMDEMKKKAKADEDAKNKKKMEEEEMDKKADEKMKNAVAAGKIKNDATVIASFKAMYLANPTETEKVIEALPVTKTAAVFNETDAAEYKDSEVEVAARKAGLKPGTGAWYNYIAINKK